MKNTTNFLKELREDRGLSQKEVSEMLNISRTTLYEVERGTKKLSFEDAIKISKIYQIDIGELVNEQESDYEKFKEMICSFVKKFDVIGVTKTKLAKLLYLADFSWYYDHNASMSGLLFRKIQYGPVPDLYFSAIDELLEKGQIVIEQYPHMEGYGFKIQPSKVLKNRIITRLSEEEQALLHDVFENWKNSSTAEIVAFTHSQKPYQSVEMNKLIPYEEIKKQSRHELY